VIPALDHELSAEQSRYVGIRNGIALHDDTGAPLGGAQRFAARWSGSLLVEADGAYEFAGHTAAPGGHDDDGGHDGHDEHGHDEHCGGRAWRVVLRRGQRSWTLLNHGMPGEEAPGHVSGRLRLRRGTYAVTVEFEQRLPVFEDAADARPTETGFWLGYQGADTGGELAVLPFDRLFVPYRDAPLSDGLVGQEPAAFDPGSGPAAWLAGLYPSSLRDIRRTYQRVFKGVLLAHRFGLSADPVRGYAQSELGHLLEHAETFAGTAYRRTGPTSFDAHLAWLDLNLLPVGDPYLPVLATDQRAAPSRERSSALFDSWERLYEYRLLRAQTREARDRPAWLLFAETIEQQPDDPAHLLRHLGVDLRHGPLTTTLFDPGTDPVPYVLGPHDLEDERWATRCWLGHRWLRLLEAHLHELDLAGARPDRWAAADPGAEVGAPPASGNGNLAGLVADALLEDGEPRRYAGLRQLSDGLRERARDALLAFLCRQDRVALPWAPGTFATEPRDLSDLLLQDVEAGLCERATRVEDGVAAVQAFVRRALLGLEPTLPVSAAFEEVWRSRFATMSTWQACVRRELYRENWVEWDRLREARRSEAFALLEQRLGEGVLDVPVPGGMAWWQGARPPGHEGLTLLQDAEPALLALLDPAPEGLGLFGDPERPAQPTWLAPVSGLVPDRGDDAGDGDGDGDGDGGDGPGPGEVDGELVERRAAPSGRRPRPARASAAEAPRRRRAVSSRAPRTTRARKAAATEALVRRAVTAVPSTPGDRLPLWLDAALSLGVPFLRVAAAGLPPGSTRFEPHEPDAGCCTTCADGAVTVDEYWFWLAGTRLYADADAAQDADAGVVVSTVQNPADQTSDWRRPEKLPALLDWPSTPGTHLWWCRVHRGEFEPPRRSEEALVLPAGATPTLEFHGRDGDSLRFAVPGVPVPVGYTDPAPPGFRYDLATDRAVLLPLVAPPVASAGGFAGLPAYPYFAYADPGAPLQPASPFAVAVTVAGALRTRCRYDAALAWYDLARPVLRSDNRWTGGVPDDATAGDRAVLLAYLETLLDAADHDLCDDGAEGARQARVLLDVLGRVLGDAPRRVAGPLGTGSRPVTLATFTPLPAPLNPRLHALYERRTERLALVHRCLDARRLARAPRRSGDAFWADPDLRDGWRTPDLGCDETACGCGSATDECGCCGGPYRFTFRLQKALELTAELRGLGAALLAAYEKGDAETLAALRSTHERQLGELTLGVRQLQWRESDWQVQALEKAKQGALTRLAYVEALLRDGLNSGELGYQTLTGVSIAARTAGNVSEGIAQGVGMSPDFWLGVAGIMGSPLQFNQFPLGNKLAAGFSTAARIMNGLAEIASSGGGLSLTEGGWSRRELEWRHQVQVIGIEIEQIERQILAAQRRRDTALRELNTYQQQVEHAGEVQDFLRDRFTNNELYLYLQRETAALHRRLYDLARQAAGSAVRAFRYERAVPGGVELPADPWDGLHRGLTAGEQLGVALRRLESAYLEQNCREYELTKHVSLRLDFPMAFLQLQQTGYTEIELPEWLFDLDYPGHYLRRIRNVTLTVPCVAGPYAGVHLKLTLLGSETRVDPRLRQAVAPCCGDCSETGSACAAASCGDGCAGGDAGPCRCPGGGRTRSCPCATGSCPGCAAGPAVAAVGYPLEREDPRAVRTYASSEAIATSSGQNDPGLFELSFRDERYLPFEFRGAVSRWRIELPPENNRFELDTLGDVVMQLNYTAREGGDALRDAARAHALCRLPGDGMRLFDVRHDFPDEWYRLQGAEDGGRLPVRLGREHFGFVPGGCDLSVTRVDVFVEVGVPGCASVLPVTFFGGHRHEHAPGEECDCAEVVECVASAEWPCLFHGVLEICRPVGGRRRDGALGEFRFGHVPGGVTATYLVCRYATRRPAPEPAAGHADRYAARQR
jgi:hypothetical protein